MNSQEVPIELRVKLKDMEDRIKILEELATKAIATAMAEVQYPDAAPTDWNGKMLYLRIPFDSLNIEKLEKNLQGIAAIIGQRKTLRDEHFKLSLEAGMQSALRAI